MQLPKGEEHFHPQDWDTYQLEAYARSIKTCEQRRGAVDLGAHVGIMTHRMAEHFKSVYAFEPIHMDLLVANTQKYTNIVYYPWAVGDRTDTVKFVINTKNSGNSHVSPSGTAERQQYALDDFNLTDIDFIKMDLEGCEYSALLGARHTITHNKPTLMIEIHKTNPHRLNIINLLTNWGYSLHRQIRKDHIWLHNH